MLTLLLILILSGQLELDLNGVRFPIADVPDAVVYVYHDNPRVIIIKLDPIFDDGFEGGVP